jgi:hypothetical protein
LQKIHREFVFFRILAKNPQENPHEMSKFLAMEVTMEMQSTHEKLNSHLFLIYRSLVFGIMTAVSGIFSTLSCHKV